MESFIQAHWEKITGVLSGFDRVRFRGTARRISSVGGLGSYLKYFGILLKDFRKYALGITDVIRKASQDVAHRANRPVLFEQDPNRSKEEIARRIAARDGITEGICNGKCVNDRSLY